MLRESADMGMDIARVLHGATTSQADGEAEAAAFARVARCVRYTVALARRLEEPAAGPAEASPQAARWCVIREVEDNIGWRAPESRESLEAELQERMDRPEFAEDLSQRPVAEIILDIRRDLGIAAVEGTQPWKRRTPNDVAALFRRTAGAGAAWPSAR